MPFTLSHPAAVLPLAGLLGRRSVWSALVIGSIAPDLPYFVAADWSRATTHTLESVAWFSVPVGGLAYLAFQLLLRRPAWFLLPAPLRARLDPAPRLAPPLSVGLCLAVGALTHIAWDSFTHDAGGIVRAHLTQLGGSDVWSYNVLQHGSTLLGAVALAAALARWVGRSAPAPLPREAGREAELRRAARLAIVAVPAAVGLAAALWVAPPVYDVTSLSWFLAHVVVAGLSTGVVVLALLAMAPGVRSRAASW